MKKFSSTPRANWRSIVEQQGLIWHSASDEPYWNEDSYYSFTSEEISTLERAGNECYEMLIEAGDYIVSNPHLLHKFNIPQKFHNMIVNSWEIEPPCLNYGRFDFGFADGQAKLFEFNCDTPTSLLEASIVQWDWKEDVFPMNDQFNGIHEALVNRWAEIAPRIGEHVWFTHADDGAGEDAINVSYMRDMAEEAGLITHGIDINDIGWNGTYFTDLDENIMFNIQHLYPWEWMVNEAGAEGILKATDTFWIEPIWKMMWSNKAILPILWQLFPNNEFLLPAYFDAPTYDMDKKQSFFKKPILSREGANITLVDNNGQTVTSTGGEYGEGPYIFQERFFLPEFNGKFPVMGVWSVDGASVGMGIREDGLITGNTAKFIPHIICD